MDQKHIVKIANELDIFPNQVTSTAELIKDGTTVPFIAKYGKEATGNLDEVAITAIRDRLSQLEELDKRKENVFIPLNERELLTDELTDKIFAAETMSKVEDIYLPFRPKRRMLAFIAKEKGLESLAKIIFHHVDRELGKTISLHRISMA